MIEIGLIAIASRKDDQPEDKTVAGKGGRSDEGWTRARRVQVQFHMITWILKFIWMSTGTISYDYFNIKIHLDELR